MAVKTSKSVEKKKKQVSELAKELPKYKTVGVLNLSGLPAKQYQSITRKLKDKLKVVYATKNVQKRAIDEAGNETLKQLESHMGGIPAVVLTNEDAFSLAKLFRQNQSPAAAKAGQEAPEDIWVKAGPTSFTPGPVISELAQLKIKAGVEAGKIAIKQDSLAVKKGETFSPLAASMLARLGMAPMKLGVKLVAAVEGKDFYLAEQIYIDEEKYLNDLRLVASQAFALAVEAGILTEETVQLLVSRAVREAKHLTEEAGILTPETAGSVLVKVERAAAALESAVPSQSPETSVGEINAKEGE